MLRIRVTSQGFVPNQVTARAGRPLRLVFLRETEHTCASEVRLPGLWPGTVSLALGKETPVDVASVKPGSYVFSCPMNRVRGTLEVRQ
ncbi:MAG: cupredoxin domain-containing protein [Armatimonadetes bacterium]|nr:cupredoxin domain-containing protein [Armatimonadota bacterium]